MAACDSVTDDLMAYCLTNPSKLNALRHGTITVKIVDSHLVTVTISGEDRVGYEIDRTLLDQVIGKLRHKTTS
jgi:hypothetical protein